MSDNSKRIDDIEAWAMVSHLGVNPSVSLPKVDFEWLIEQVRKAEQLEKDIKFHEKLTAKYISSKEI